MAGILCEFCVVAELQHNLLIGTDDMQKCNAATSYEEASITLNEIAHGWMGTKATCASMSGDPRRSDWIFHVLFCVHIL